MTHTGHTDLSHLLAAEWRPALGCTEPAAVAYAAASAAALAGGEIRCVRLVCDPRMYKNCYAVGIPNSGRRTGILWALAIGAMLEDASCKLECFRGAGEATLRGAGALVERGALTVEVERTRTELYVECTVERAGGVGRAVLEREHTRLVRLERDGEALPLDVGSGHDETAAARARGPPRSRSRRRSPPRAPPAPPSARRCNEAPPTTWRSPSTACRSCPKGSCGRSRPTRSPASAGWSRPASGRGCRARTWS